MLAARHTWRYIVNCFSKIYITNGDTASEKGLLVRVDRRIGFKLPNSTNARQTNCEFMLNDDGTPYARIYTTIPSTNDNDGRPRTRALPSLVTIIIFLFSFRHILFIFCWTFYFGFYICSSTAARNTSIILSCIVHEQQQRHDTYAPYERHTLPRHSTVRNYM